MKDKKKKTTAGRIDRPASWPQPSEPIYTTRTAAPGDIVTEVYNFIIDGHSNAEIIEYLAAAGHDGLAAKHIFEQAIDAILKSSRLPPAVRIGWCLEAYLHLYSKMKSTGDFAGAMKAVQEISKLSDAIEKVLPAAGDSVSGDILADEVSTYLGSIIDKEMAVTWKE